MANSSSKTKEKRNQHDTYSGNNSTMPPPQRFRMRHNAGIAVTWTAEEVATLYDGLVRYSSELNVSRYAKIAFSLQNKTVRDVAMRCRWINKNMENKKKEEHNKVMALNLTEEDVITNNLLEENIQLLKQISANQSFNIIDNYTLLATTRENIMKLVTTSNENLPETMKNMPPLPVELNDELADFILPPSNLP